MNFSGMRPRMELAVQEVVKFDAGLTKDRAQRTFRHVARMIRNRGVSIRIGIEPDLVRARGLSIEREA